MSKTAAIRTGVRDFYVAKATTTEGQSGTTVTYGTPEVFGGTATVGVAFERADNKVYESDVPIHNSRRMSGATITYESRSVDLASELDVLHNVSAEASTGAGYEDGPDDVGGEYAVGWADALADGTYKCQWYYYCTGHKGDETHETATESTTTPTDSFVFDAVPNPATGKLRRRAVVASKAAMEAFFAAVLPTT
ncbi:MAG: hypothetical protein J6S60_09090 [Oscillospiraceae bacterium]|nr:hypothetical protein [Oscillospiraceae bacterium]